MLYDPFGSIIEDTNPSLPLPIGFAGGLHDRDLGFVRFGWRDYDPNTARWTAPDPLGDAGGDKDWYGYCLDDPVNGVDPLGLFAFGGLGIALGLGAMRVASVYGPSIARAARVYGPKVARAYRTYGPAVGNWLTEEIQSSMDGKPDLVDGIQRVYGYFKRKNNEKYKKGREDNKKPAEQISESRRRDRDASAAKALERAVEAEKKSTGDGERKNGSRGSLFNGNRDLLDRHNDAKRNRETRNGYGGDNGDGAGGALGSGYSGEFGGNGGYGR